MLIAVAVWAGAPHNSLKRYIHGHFVALRVPEKLIIASPEPLVAGATYPAAEEKYDFYRFLRCKLYHLHFERTPTFATAPGASTVTVHSRAHVLPRRRVHYHIGFKWY